MDNLKHFQFPHQLREEILAFCYAGLLFSFFVKEKNKTNKQNKNKTKTNGQTKMQTKKQNK